MNFPMVALGELLTPVSRPESVDSEKEYRILGAHWYAEGLYIKYIKLGSEIQANKVYRIEKGDFVYNRLFAWKGSFAVATYENHGCYVSNEFPCFKVDSDSADSKYLWLYFSRAAIWEEALGLSTGGTPTSRNRLKEEKFLAMQISLPPLSEQRRIVARIEELAAKIEEARGLRKKAGEETKILSNTASKTIFGHPNKTVGEIANVTKLAGFEYTEYFTNAPSGGVKVIRAGNVRNEGLNLLNAMTIPEEVSDALPRSQLKPGDVVMTFIGAKIGDVTYIRNDYPRLHCGPNVAKLTPNEQILNIFLVKALQSYIVQNQIEDITKSTAQPNLSMKTIRQLKVPVPPLPEQRRIVAYLDALQTKVDALRRLQSEIGAELDALLPAVLDRAFKGEM